MNTTSSAQPGFAVAGVAPGDIFEKPDQTFPRLPAEMVDRVLRYGHPETFDGGAYLYQFGERAFDFFLILDPDGNWIELSRRASIMGSLS